jgi:DNA-directed RNA polymerase
MATPQQLDRQFHRELEARKEAIQRLRERTKVAEDRAYASSTVYGSSFINNGLKAITEKIETQISHITRGWASDKAAAVQPIKDCDPAVLALITAKGVLDVLGQRKLERPTYAALTYHIGGLVYDQLLLDAFEEKHKDLFKQAKQHLHAHKGYSYKVQRYRATMRKHNIQPTRWSSGAKVLIGGWLVDRLTEATGWIATRVVAPNGRKRQTVVDYQPEFLKAKEALMAQAEAFAACLWPMLCEPNDWPGDSSSTKGGYLTNDLRKLTTLVRSAVPKKRHWFLRDSQALAMLNRLQKVPYRINSRVLEVANFCMERRITVGKFRAEEPTPPPPKPEPWEEASLEDQLAYRRARTQIEDNNSALAQKNYRTAEAVFVANKYREDVFWIPWSFDFRGRVYPIPTSLSPQGTDFDKSLIYFHEEGPVNEWWLAFQVATTYGLDKETMETRIQWVKDHVSLIERIADDPEGTINEWSVAEEPWCFLAAALEYNNCVIKRTKLTSGLPVSVDATCSGLQHLSALALDRTAAEMVNVVPTLKPSDGYRIVAEKAKEVLPAHLHPLMTRKVTKRTVMTTPYGVTENSARDYIRQELKGVKLEKGELQMIVKAIYRYGVRQVFAGPCKSMEFIQRVAYDKIKQGATTIEWVTPSGFQVVQEYRKNELKPVQTKLLGQRIQTYLNKEWDERAIDSNKAKTAAAPNLIHSLDAALLHLVFADWLKPFTVIHDCVLGRSCDMDEMGSSIRDKFVEIYSKPVLKEWAESLGAEFDESVMENTLDINDVQTSSYFFC